MPAISTFAEFVAVYGKTYVTVEEYQMREGLFLKALTEINRIQEAEGQHATYSIQVNEFADLNEQEFMMFSSGGKSLQESQDESEFFDFEDQKVVDYQFE